MIEWLKASARKRPAVAGLIGGVAVTASVAVAAFVIYQGLSGSLGGKVTASSTVGALTFSANPATIPVEPGGSGSLNWHVTNADTTHPQKITSISVDSITTDKAGCAGSNFTANVGSLIGYTVAAGGSDDNSLTSGLSAAANTPSACADAVVTVAISGATQAQ